MHAKLPSAIILLSCLILVGPAGAWQESGELPHTISLETTHFVAPYMLPIPNR